MHVSLVDFKHYDSTIRSISRTVVLLNYLVFGTEPTLSLRQRLHHAPHRQFNGISYMFIVTFGTLSYSDPPEWTSDTDRLALEQIAGEVIPTSQFWL
jgi:hypothetical protein